MHKPGHCVWCTGWISSDFCEGPVKAPSSWQESFTWNFHWIRIYRVENSEKRHFWLQTLRSRKMRQKSMFEDSKEIITPRSGEQHFILPIADGTAKLSGRDQGVRESTLTRDQPARSEDLREDLQGNSETSQPLDENKRWRWSPKWLLVNWGGFHLSSSPRTSSSAPRAERRNIPNTTERYLTWPGIRTQIWTCCEKAVLMIIGKSMWIEVRQTQWQDSRSVHHCM